MNTNHTSSPHTTCNVAYCMLSC